jgi:subtilisin family serine protease
MNRRKGNKNGRMKAFSRVAPLVIVLWCAVGQGAPIYIAESELDAATIQGIMRTQKVAEAGRALSEVSQKRAVIRNNMGRHIRSLLVSGERGVQAEAKKLELSSGSVQPVTQGNPFVRTRTGNQVQVNIRTDELEQSLLDQLTYSGLEIEIADHSLQQVQGWIAVSRLDQLAGLAGVRQIRVPRYGQSRRGSVNTAGDTILKANQLRANGLTGSGIRVGIISDGANNWTSARASGDLPSALTRYGSCSTRTGNPSQCLSRRTCNEGTAMAEIIYDMAPGTKLAVAAAGTSLEFVQRVNQLVNVFKADIIVDDLGFYAEPYFEDGDIAQGVAAVAGKVLFISAAGNSGDGHYEKNYRAVPSGSIHDFGRAEGQGEDSAMGVIIPGRDYLLMLMQWNDPFASSSNDYDMALFDQQTNLVAGSFEAQTGNGSEPFEGICYYNSSSSEKLHFVVVDKSAGANKRLEMFNLSSSVQEYNHASGSIFGHPGVESVLAVGTINANDSGHNSVAFYSSRGPSRIDFPSIKNRKKPDLMGIDGIRVTGAGGFPSTFYGTSAAAPHVAAVAALLMSSSSSVSPYAVSRALKDGAWDLGSKGFDSTYGYGRVDAVRALELLKTGFPISGALLLLLLD